MSLPPLSSPTAGATAGDYNSRVQHTARMDLVGGGGSGSGSPTDEDPPAGMGFGASFESERITQPSSRTSSRPGSKSKGLRSAQHREAVAALENVAASAASASSGAAVQQLMDDTMDQYQAMLSGSSTTTASTAAASPSASSSASGSATPSSVGPSSSPAQPSAPKRMFSTTFSAAAAHPPSTSSGAASSATSKDGSNVSGSGTKPPAGMKSLRVLHASVQSTLGNIQSKTSKILQDQERDLLRSFKIRLLEVNDELEGERKKNESGSVEWVARCRVLSEELEWVRDLTTSLSTENKNLLKENRKATRAAQTQEADRSFLITQLVTCKKENARLRYLVEHQLKENQDSLLAMQSTQPLHQGLLAYPPSTPLTSHALAAHTSSSGQGSPVPKLRFQSIGGSASYNNQPNTAPHRLGSSSGSLSASPNHFPSAPAGMRASLLAAATTEFASSHSAGGGGGGRPQTGPDYMPSSSPRGTSRQGTTPLLPESRLAGGVGAEKRFQTVVAKLKKSLDVESARARTMRSAYLNEVQSRTQLQHLFKSCLDAVKEQQAAQQQQQAKSGGKKGSPSFSRTGPLLTPAPGFIFTTSPPLDPRLGSISGGGGSGQATDLCSRDKLALIEWFLSQPSVLHFLFERMFPASAQSQPYANLLAGAAFGEGYALDSSSAPGGSHVHSGHPAHSVPLQFDYAQFLSGPSSSNPSTSVSAMGSPVGPQHRTLALGSSPDFAAHGGGHGEQLDLDSLAYTPQQLAQIQRAHGKQPTPHQRRSQGQAADEYKE